MTAATLEVTLPELHPSQRAIRDDPARYKVVCCGRRWGKTLLGVLLCYQAALRGGRTWWIGPSYKQAMEGWRYLKWLAQQTPLAEVREGEMEIRLPTGGEVQVRTASDPDLLRGSGLDGLVIDEAALVDEELWTKVLPPALSDNRGWAVFISTPRGNNWFRRLHDEAKTRHDWASWQLPSWDRPGFDREEVAASRIGGMSEDEIEQEYGASFLVSQDKIYNAFSRAKHLLPLPSTTWHGGAVGADYGDVHPSTVVAVTRDQSGRLWVRECWYGDGDAGRWSGAMGEQCEMYGIDRSRIRIDPTQRSAASAFGLTMQGGKAGHLQVAQSGDGSRRARIGYVMRLLNSGGLFFDIAGKGILRLAGEMEVYRWDRYPDGTLKDTPYRHGEDGVAALEDAVEELEGQRVIDLKALGQLMTYGQGQREKRTVSL